MILVLAAPYSGARTFYKLLLAAGYNVGYNQKSADGAVKSCRYNESTCLCFDGEKYMYVYHLVSNPLNCIAALANDERMVTKNQPADIRYALATHYWLAVSRHIEKFTRQIIRIEDLRKTWPQPIYRPKRFVRFRHLKKPLANTRLNKLGDIRHELIQKAHEYGYSL